MARYYCDHGLGSGSNDGSDWEDAFQNFNTCLSSLSSTDELWVKEHSGIDCSSSNRELTTDVLLHGGFDSSLTGTNGSLGTRTGLTVLDGSSANRRGIKISSGGVTISRLKIYDFAYGSLGGGISLEHTSGTVTLNDLEIDTCSAGGGGGGFVRYPGAGDVVISGGSVHDCSSGVGYWGGGYIQNNTVTITDVVFYSNTDEGLRLDSDYITVDRCTFYSNTNSGLTSSGGGLVITGSTSAGIVRNCLFHSNSAANGSAVSTAAAGVDFTNCTFANNTATTSSTIYSTAASHYEVSNCILYENSPSDGVEIDDADVADCDVEDLAGSALNSCTDNGGNIDTDPYFLDSGDDPWSLSGSTPTSVTQGADTGATGFVDWDLLEVDRDNSTPSMGCYEYVGGASEYSDVLLTAGLTLSAATMATQAAFTDVPQTAGLTLSAATIAAARQLDDVPLTAGLTLAAADFQGQAGHTDTPQTAGLTLSAADFQGQAAHKDVPLTAGLTLAVDDIDAFPGSTDALLTAGLTLSADDIAAAAAYTDAPQTAGLTLAADDISAAKSKIDAPQTADLTLSCATMAAAASYIDAPQVAGLLLSAGDFTGQAAYTDAPLTAGLTLSAADVEAGRQLGDVPLTAGLTLSAATMAAVAAYIDAPQTAGLTLSVSNIIAGTVGTVQMVIANALTEICDEMSTRILGLTPNRMVKNRATFMRHKNDKKKITTMTGRSRLFEIGEFVFTGRWHAGYIEHGVMYEAPLVLVYERSKEWNAAALDDANKIYHDLLSNPTTVDEVALRTIKPSIPMVTRVEHESAQWDYYTMIIEAYLSVSAS